MTCQTKYIKGKNAFISHKLFRDNQENRTTLVQICTENSTIP